MLFRFEVTLRIIKIALIIVLVFCLAASTALLVA